MCPDVSFLNISLYWWLIIIGVLLSFVTFSLLSRFVKVPNKVFNFALITSVLAIVMGFLGATLFQSLYNFIQSGQFKVEGLTFSSGLITAVVFYILFYFVVGHFVFKKEHAIHVGNFPKIAAMSFPAIVIAHCFGRFGCLTAGCCYGKLTDQWYGINMYINGHWEVRMPTQLWEAIFLLVLFIVLVFLLIKFKCKYIPEIYLISYGIWRFFLEFVRDDPRGSIGSSNLTPSQILSIVMVVAGIALIICKITFLDKFYAKYEQE